MKLKRIILSMCLLLVGSLTVFADSPLTSTDFANAYSNEVIVIKASNTNGVLTNELMDYLTNQKNPLDVKMALINKLGWNFDGKNNAEIFMNYLKVKYKYDDMEKFLKKGKKDDLLSMVYLKAMDNYFEVDDAIMMGEKALKKNKKSRTANIIVSLIKAQKAMDNGDKWCEVYQMTNGVRENKKLKNDIKQGALDIIYEYMDGYQEYCK